MLLLHLSGCLQKLFDIKAQWQIFIAIITAATLFIGNITAVFQQSVKRMLAYSSIAQVGFMLFSLLTLNILAKEGIILYTAVYSIATIGLFAILVKMKDYSFDGFNGLATKISGSCIRIHYLPAYPGGYSPNRWISG